ncbi:unnamed protein product [Dracunculus medinensis]|uniref:Glyco_tran_10_N domain-containing protein n=1 Tax=Dracunculus medinensis TaxID=318479 RepID=A0A0N4UN09_DRAME|nr:unnamed protein product [Dracunculus medinensis]
MNIYTTDTDFNEVIGSWAIWPLFKTLRNRPEANWLLFCEAHIHVNLELLVNFLANYSSDAALDCRSSTCFTKPETEENFIYRNLPYLIYSVRDFCNL